MLSGRTRTQVEMKGRRVKRESILERKKGTIDVKRGRVEIWKGIREREQLIRREKQ